MPPSTPAEERQVLQTADALVRDCRSLAALGWPLELLVRCVVAVEELTDLPADPQRETLRAVAIDLYAFLVGIEEITHPSAAHAEELARLTEALATAVGERDRGVEFIDLLSTHSEMPAALAAAFAEAGFQTRVHRDGRHLVDAARRRPAAALLVDSALLPAACALLDTLARELPACAATVVFAVGDELGRLEALLQGAEDHAAAIDDADLAARVLERLAPEKESPYLVAVVDDDPHSRGYLRVVLEQAGIVVHEFADPAVAAAQLPAAPPDLLLVDLYMPSLDGLSLTMQLRRHPGLALMPILFVSGEEDERARFRAIEAGADEFLRKPVRPRVLLGEVRSRIRRARRVVRQPLGAAPQARRHGQLRRGDFLEQMAQVLRHPGGGWNVLLSLKVDQAGTLAQRLGQAGAYDLEQAIAARFAELLRAEDAYTLWLEFGFGILLRRETREDVVALAGGLCRLVAAAPFAVGDEELRLTLSIGVALPPTGAAARDPDRWFAAAYAGMSIAHRLGGDRHDGVLGQTPGGMPAERALIIREFVKDAARGENMLHEYQPMLPLRSDEGGAYAQNTKLRDFRAPLAGIRRDEYLDSARDGGALVMMERLALFNAFEAIRQERERGRNIRILVPVDAGSLDTAQLSWLASEAKRRRLDAARLIVELDAAALRAQPGLAATLATLKDLGLTVSVAEHAGSLAHVDELALLPADLLRLPHAALGGVSPEALAEVLAPWRAAGRGVIVDDVGRLDTVSQLWDLGIDYLQGDALAAGGPRLDYDFVQVGH